MNEELLQKLYNDLDGKGRGLDYDKFKSNLSDKPFFDAMYNSARLYYGQGTVPVQEDFADQLGITAFGKGQRIAQEQQVLEQQRIDNTPIPNVPMSAEPGAAALYALDQTDFGHGLMTLGKNTTIHTIPAGIQAAGAAEEQHLSDRYKSAFDQLADIPDGQMVSVNDPAIKVGSRRSESATLLRGTAHEIRTQLLEGINSHNDKSTESLLKGIELMQSMPYDPTIVQEYQKAEGFSGWSSYIGSSLGQLIPQMAASTLAPGVGSYIQESGQIHLDAIEKIKRENPNMTYEDIVKQRMVDFEAGERWGAGAAAIDLVSLGLIGKFASPMFRAASKRILNKGIKEGGLEIGEELTKKGIKNLRKFSKGKNVVKAGAAGALTEAPTEFTQEWMAEMGAREASGIDIGAEHDWDRYKNAGVIGAIGGGFAAGGGANVSNQMNAGSRGKAETIANQLEASVTLENLELKGQINSMLLEGETLVTEAGGISTELDNSLSSTEADLVALGNAITGDVNEAKAIKDAEHKEYIEKTINEVKGTPASAADIKISEDGLKNTPATKENTLVRGVLDFIGGGIFTDKFKSHVDRKEGYKASAKKTSKEDVEANSKMMKGKLRSNNLSNVLRSLSDANNAVDLGMNQSKEVKAKAIELYKVLTDLEQYRKEGKGAMTVAQKKAFAKEVNTLAKTYIKERNADKATNTTSKTKGKGTATKGTTTKTVNKTTKTENKQLTELEVAQAAAKKLEIKKKKATITRKESALLTNYKKYIADKTRGAKPAPKVTKKPKTNAKNTTKVGTKQTKSTPPTKTNKTSKGNPKKSTQSTVAPKLRFVKDKKTGKGAWAYTDKEGKTIKAYKKYVEQHSQALIDDATNAVLGKIAKNTKHPLHKEAREELTTRKRIKELAPDKSLSETITTESFPLGTKKKKGSKSVKVAKTTVDRVANYYIDNFSSSPSKKQLMSEIAKLNETLEDGSKITDSMANSIWNRVRKQTGETKHKALKKLVDKNTTTRNAKGIKIGAWVDDNTAKTMQAISEAMEGGRVDDHYKELKRLEAKEQKEGLSPEESMEKLIASLGAYKKLDPVSQKIIFDNIKELVTTGRNKFLDNKKKIAKVNQNMNELVLNTIEGTDNNPADKQYKVKNVYAEYKEGDVVILQEEGGRLVKMTLLADMPGADLKSSNENINVKTLEGVGRKGGKSAKTGVYKWLSADSIFGVEEIVDRLASRSSLVNRQYNSKLVQALTRGLREAGPAEQVARYKANQLIEKARVEVIGEGSLRTASKRHAQLQEKAFSKEELATFNKENKGLLEGNEDTLGEILKRWMELYATDIKSNYNHKGFNADQTQASLGKVLPTWAKNWGKWQLGFYDEMYNRINKVYKEVYGTDLDKINGYSPTIALDSNGNAETNILDFTGDMLSAYNPLDTQSKSQTVNQFKHRVGSIPKSVDADKMLLSFVNQMEHFIAFAKPLATFNSVLSNKTTRAIIGKRIGGKYVEYLDQHMKTIANGRLDSGNKQWNRIAEKIRGNVVTAALSINFTLLPKQLVSFPAYLANISWNPIEVAKYTKHMAEGLLNPKKVLDLFMAEDWIQARWKGGYERDINTAEMAAELTRMASVGLFSSRKNIYKDISKLKNYLISKGMMATKVGDVTAIMLGGYPMYMMNMKALQKEGFTKEEAHKEAMFQVQKSSELSQQSPFSMDLGMLQKGSSFERLFTMFMTSPFQYRRQVVLSTRNYISAVEAHGFNSKQARSKGKEVAKRILIYHVLLPMAFNLASGGFFAPRDEEGEIDYDYLIGGSLLGSIVGIPVLGSVLKGLFERVMGGKKYKISVTPVSSMIDEVLTTVARLAENPSDPELLFETLEAAALLKGIPLKPANRLITNNAKLNSNYGRNNYTTYEKFLLRLGYSEYAVKQLKTEKYFGKSVDWKGKKKGTR